MSRDLTCFCQPQVVQLVELLEVRHSVFIIGWAGTGKSEVWKTLYKTYSNMKFKPHYDDLEPKAVTNDELFGIINPANREWVDGKRRVSRDYDTYRKIVLIFCAYISRLFR